MLAWEIEVRGRVGGDEVLAAEGGKEASDAAESGNLGIGGEGFLATGREVVKEVVLVVAEIGSTELAWVVELLLFGPLGKLAQCPAVGVDGGSGIRAAGEGGEKGIDVGIEPLVRRGLGQRSSAFAASAHGGDVCNCCRFGHEDE